MRIDASPRHPELLLLQPLVKDFTPILASRMRLSVIPAEKRSTRFGQEAPGAVRCAR